MVVNIVVLAIALAVSVLLLSPRLRTSTVWRATVTPLASIIGSGFLIALPLHAQDLGAYAIGGMVALLTLAYLIGGVIRFNIIHGEPLFEDRGCRALGWLERVSHLALGLAYFISVTYYLTCWPPSC